jgi:hypothetical protein
MLCDICGAPVRFAGDQQLVHEANLERLKGQPWAERLDTQAAGHRAVLPDPPRLKVDPAASELPDNGHDKRWPM